MDKEFNALQRLILLHTFLLGRVTIQELAEKCWCAVAKLYRYMPGLERSWWLKSFNLARQWTPSQATIYYKVYGIHFDYIETMKKHCMIFTNSETWEEVKAEWSENLTISFAVDGDQYEWDRDRRCLTKNWKPMDTEENVKAQMWKRMRWRRAVGKSIRVPDACTDEEVAEAKKVLAQWHKREMDDLDAQYWIWQK